MMGCSPRFYIPSFVEISPPVLEKIFYHIWAWRPSWSCDLDFAIKLEKPLPKEAPHKISTRLAKRFQRGRSLKLWTTDDGSWPSCKLTFSSGEPNQRTIGPENAHLKPDLGVFSHHEMTLTLNTHTPLLTSQVVCICKVSGLRLQ